VGTGGPTVRSLRDLLEGAIKFGTKPSSGIWTALEVPVEGCIVFGRGFDMKLNRLIGHRVTSPSSGGGLPPME
jgi:hypothetical protein